ncbi:hypothetical protein [Sphingomonas sp. NIBR02145]|jgi:hypothetical protein|uniref:hypothetical protein n=1 Tax=Sphingomonas sp. NIBR02145 TaxID=3014784 RepID=UPI0022B315C6|nr:hypothetical protein [Sphingomonas sp. NIBR02145]WHU02643.1 hypothetical protein O3305_21095 [Sphingomonas sp. NIBR02145]
MLIKTLRFLSLALALTAPLAAQAYTGPGLGLGAIGVAFGLIGSILLAIVSVVWYPVKRLVRRIRGRAR